MQLSKVEPADWLLLTDKLPAEIGPLPYYLFQLGEVNLISKNFHLAIMFLVLSEPYFLSVLTLLVLVSVGFLHFLLFREYAKQDKLQSKRLQDLENLVLVELFRSKSMNLQNQKLDELNTKTQEQLEIVKLQVNALKKSEGNR